MFPVFSTPWFDSGYMLRQITKAFLASALQKTAEFPQLQFLDGRGHSLRYAEADPHGPDCLADHRDFATASTRRTVDVPVVLVVQPSGGVQTCRKLCCLVVYMPVVVHDKFGVFLGPCT